MPTNVYFNTGTKPEQRLYENLIIEQLRAFGQDVYYLPRKLVNEDTLFGEDTLSSFNDAYQIEMYLDNIEGFEGQKEMMTRFGLDMAISRIQRWPLAVWRCICCSQARSVTQFDLLWG